MTRLILLISASLMFGGILEAKILVSTNGQSLKLGIRNRCHQLETLRKQDICDCCLIHKVMVRKQSYEMALTKCMKNNQCRPSKPDDLASFAIRKFERAKINLSPLELVNLEHLASSPDLPDDGILTTDHAVQILFSLKKNNLLVLPDSLFLPHKSYLCLEAKALGAQVKGVHSGQLFAISYNRRCLGTENKNNWQPLYILKETKKGLKEITNLHKLSRSVLSQEKIATEQLILNPDLFKGQEMARITFEDRHFIIKTPSKTRYFSLLQTAPGKSLDSHLRTFVEKTLLMGPKTLANSKELKEMKHIFFRIGFATAKLHRKYARTNLSGQVIIGNTYYHGDFHAQNIFYERTSEDVTLIDNETFALSIAQQSSGINDLVDLYLLHSVKTVAHRFAHSLETNLEMGIDDQTWHALWQELLIGYIKASEPKNSFEITTAYNELRSVFYQGLSNASIFTSVRNLKDQRVLKRIGPSMRRSYLKRRDLDDTFDEVLARLINEN